MHDRARTANLLGATTLALSDLALAGAARDAGVSASGAAALVSLSSAPGLGVTELGRRIGLSQSAAARMVDALVANGLVERSPTAGRQVSVALTPSGARTVRRLLSVRGGRLAAALAVLDDDEQDLLAGLLGKLLTGLHGEAGSADLMCRLCDRDACVRNAACPVGRAERERGS
ncbi:MarR family transcriptional regulator [Streptomyces lycii]|uniref:MarR family transcriptional regulator n=1 Tax=Streptomyces lycii TaxID=2654337 RepID=A0ABQ7FPR1_9ACTN|nr:MarR family transcriptional regulator [Streptomyces lycii]KAF4410922.1 MarR family transcriptional regulator [Streptomyces lycii]